MMVEDIKIVYIRSWFSLRLVLDLYQLINSLYAHYNLVFEHIMTASEIGAYNILYSKNC